MDDSRETCRPSQAKLRAQGMIVICQYRTTSLLLQVIVVWFAQLPYKCRWEGVHCAPQACSILHGS